MVERERERVRLVLLPKKGGERERERGLFQVEIGMLRGYICVLIGEMWGQRMPIPPATYILGRDLPIRRHESKYMLAPPGTAGS